MISRSWATASIRLAHPSKKRKDGTLSILLRITFQRKSRYFSLGYTATEEVFDKLFNGQVRGDLKDLKLKLNNIEAKANEILNSLDHFTFVTFEEKFFRPRSSKSNVILYLKYEVDKAQSEGRVKSKAVALGSMRSFEKYINKGELNFEDISVIWLKGYEKYMLAKGKSPSTIGMYLRTLRVVFNKAIVDGIISKDLYPFGRGKYVIPESRNIKKAIDKKDLQKFLDYKPVFGNKEDWAKDMWIFIFLCNGINPKDVALLRYKNLDKEYIAFFRSKTSNTRKLQQPIIVPLDKKMKDIIYKWGNKPEEPDKYIFNVLKSGLTPEQIDSKIHDFYSHINSFIKSICEKAGIANKITTMTARHSYATFMMRNGAPIELISENMGHTNVATTKNYLASFDLDVKKEWNSRLFDF